MDCQRFDHVLEAKIETSLLGDGERQGVGNFGQLRRKLRPESGCPRLLWQVRNNCKESIKGSFPESLAKQLRRLMSLNSLQYPDGTRVRQVLSTMTLRRDVESVECTGGRGRGIVVHNSHIPIFPIALSWYNRCFHRHGGSYNEYVNYDWEDARERDLRDREGRVSYFRTRCSHFLCDKNYAHCAFFVF